MKNIHLLPTNNPSNICKLNDKLFLSESKLLYVRKEKTIPQYIYITNDEEIKLNDWVIDTYSNLKIKCTEKNYGSNAFDYFKKIILTTNIHLIREGIQPIEENFLKWFINNSSCEFVHTRLCKINPMGRVVDPMNYEQNQSDCVWKYLIKLEDISFTDSIKNSISTIYLANKMFGSNERNNKQYTREEIDGFDDFKEFIENKNVNVTLSKSNTGRSLIDSVLEEEIIPKELENISLELYPILLDYETNTVDINKNYRKEWINGVLWQQENSQKVVPFDATDIEVFSIKPDETGKLFAYIGYKISNGNFHFSIVPFTENKNK